jgi:eukaryotic-like serine/threonine-protein kinase
MMPPMPVGAHGQPTMPPSPVQQPMSAPLPSPPPPSGIGYHPVVQGPPPRHNALWVLVGLLLLVLVGLGVWAIAEAVHRNNSHAPTGTGTVGSTIGQPAALSTGAPPGRPEGLLGDGAGGTVTLNAQDYLGRSADLVVSELAGQQLRTRLTTTTGAAPANPAGCVVRSVTPTGTVSIDTVVTVTCSPHEATG